MARENGRKKQTLAERVPELVAEWNLTKNGDLTPMDISYGSARKVWWRCVEGHEWESSPNHRSRGRGCPVCGQKKREDSRNRNMLARRGSLVDTHPMLAMQWHPTKNGSLLPMDVLAGSGNKVWWRCEKGHEWEATIGSRKNGVNCPVCSGHKIIAGINDLATVKPELAAQWHPTRNGVLTPKDVTICNGNKAWWICEKGHEWEARIANRTNGCDCPVCSGKKVLIGYNDLASQNPYVAEQWHPTKNGNLTPEAVTSQSNKKVWWMCKKGHEWEATVAHRNEGTRCPICFGESKTSFPEQAIFYYISRLTTALSRYKANARTEIDVYLPEYKIGVEYDGVRFHSGEKAKCREQRKQEILDKLGIVLLRVKEYEGMPPQKISENVIYLRAGPTDAMLTEALHQLLGRIGSLTQIMPNVMVDLTKDRSAIYEQYVENEKANSLLAVDPNLAAQWHPTKNGMLLPEYVSISSNKKVWWQCAEGHEWTAVVCSRKIGSGCPYCAGKRAVVGVTDLATVNPKVAAQWHPTKNGKLTARDVLPASNKAVWWMCEIGHEWKTQVTHRSKSGCPICSGHKVLAGFNDLATRNPKLANQWHPTKNGNLFPTDVTCGSDKRVWWKCPKGHEWEAVISSRYSGVGCPYCAGQRLQSGENDLATVNPTLAAQWHPTQNGTLTAKDVVPGSNKKAWWICEKGHVWKAAISSRNAGAGCPYCANQKVLVGFNDLATLNPVLATEWHPTKNGTLSPRDVTPGSNKRVWWQCEKGHEWENSIITRCSGHRCPYCFGQLTIPGVNDLSTVNPQLASQWHPTKNESLLPSDVRSSSNKKVWWVCGKGHEWAAVINSRNKGVGCPCCAGKQAWPGYNDLATLDPELASEWHPTLNGSLTPADVTLGSNKKIWWLCKNGHEFERTVNARKKVRGCPYCRQESVGK